MPQTPLHSHVLEKDFEALAKTLNDWPSIALDELNQDGDSFKTLAIKTCTASEFDQFCRILQHYYLSKTLAHTNSMAARYKLNKKSPA